MNQAAPQLLGVDGRPLSAAVTVWSAGASLTKDQRLALEAGGEGWMLAQGAAGKPVTMNSALTLSAVFACISRTAQAIAQLPLDVFARTTAGRMKESGWLYELLSVSPNADQTPAEFWEGILSWTCARGNGYAEIDYVGEVAALRITIYANAKDSKGRPYASWVEHGTLNSRASPFFWPAYRSLRRRVYSRIYRAVKKSIKEA